MLKISVFSQDTVREKKKIRLKFKVTDQDSRPVKAHLGLSVYDHLFRDPSEQKNIFTHYYLSSELKGKIHDPAYYFNEKNQNRWEHLDLLLLTQGWRSYYWQEDSLREVIQDNQKIVYENQKGQVFAEGKKELRKLAQKGEIHLLFTGHIISIPTDANGVFTLPESALNVSKGHHFFLKPDQNENALIKIPDRFELINKWASDKKFAYPDRFLESELEKESKFLQKLSLTNTNLLDEIVVKAHNHSRNKYKGQVYEGNVSDYLCAEYNILNCVNHGPGFVKPVDGQFYKLNGGRLVQYKAKFSTDNPEVHNFKFIKGYHLSKKFYQPNYDTGGDGFPDYRNTLIWEPDLITNEEGIAEISFFTSSNKSVYLGRVEGVDGSGQLGAANFRFVVHY